MNQRRTTVPTEGKRSEDIGAQLESMRRRASELAHDLGNALIGITGFCRLALQNSDATDPVHGFVREIMSASDAASHVMEGIRGLADGAFDTRDVDLQDEDECVLADEEIVASDHTVLVVDDDQFVRRVAGLLLADAGFNIIDAEAPAVALELTEEQLRCISVILSDIMMPGMTGPEMVRCLEERRQGIPAVYMSGLPKRELVATGYIESSETLLEKPFGEETLLDSICKAIKA